VLSNIPPLPCSGRAIESTVQTKLYNLHNPEDNMLHPGWVYTEDYALGLDGSYGSEPDNYQEYSVFYTYLLLPMHMEILTQIALTLL
jgi:hypothetical protein